MKYKTISERWSNGVWGQVCSGVEGGKKLNLQLLHQVIPMALGSYGQRLSAESLARICEVSERAFEKVRTSNFLIGMLSESSESRGWEDFVREHGVLLFRETDESATPRKVNDDEIRTCINASVALIRYWDDSGVRDILQQYHDLANQPEETLVDQLPIIAAVASVCALCAFALAVLQLVNPSKQFRAILSQSSKARWAAELVKCGPLLAERTMWTVEKAWPTAVQHLTLDDKRNAVEYLSTWEEFTPIRPERGLRLNHAEMVDLTGNSGQFVCKLVCPGLRTKIKIIEQAAVLSSTEDYVALAGVREHQLTEVYKSRSCNDRPGQEFWDNRSLRLKPNELKDIEDYAINNLTLFDDWLMQLIREVPENLFQPVAGELGVPFDKNMDTNSDLLNRSNAKVVCIRVRGLKRSSGDILLRAKVDAADSTTENR